MTIEEYNVIEITERECCPLVDNYIFQNQKLRSVLRFALHFLIYEKISLIHVSKFWSVLIILSEVGFSDS